MKIELRKDFSSHWQIFLCCENHFKRVAKLAVAALHKLSKPKKELAGKVKSGSKSKSVLEKIRERRSGGFLKKCFSLRLWLAEIFYAYFWLGETEILIAPFWKPFSVNDEIEAPLSNTDIFKKSKLNPNYKLARQLRKGSEIIFGCQHFCHQQKNSLNPSEGIFYKNQNAENWPMI